jgi:serine/threonine protein kinase
MKDRRVESVEGFCELLGRSRLLAGDEVLLVEQRWHREADEPADLGRFTSWLVANQYATDFQVAMILHGHGAQLHLGPYKLLERIGKGRLAMVYKALHRLGRLVALKVLPPSRAREPDVLARFQQEARLAQGLNHVNVVRTFEAGEEHGLHYLVMEYLVGETLQQTLDRRGRLEVAEAVDIVYQALLGLQHVHEQGLVHRNLEPANLMLIQESGMVSDVHRADAPKGPLVKILDMSLSSPSPGPVGSTLPEGQGAGRLAYEGLLLVRPGYLAPEQARDTHSADIRADIYTLGCILYHALAGQPPHPDDRPLRQIIRHATETPRPLRECNPTVPEGLELIVNWMMAKEPSQRYQSPERAAGALATFQVGESSAPPAADPVADMLPPPDAPLSEWEVYETKEPPPAVTSGTNQPPVSAAATVPGPFEFATPERAEVSNPVGSAVSSLEVPSDPGMEEKRFAEMGPRGRGLMSQQKQLGRREYLLLVLGAAGLLVAQAIGWLLGKVSHP